MSDRKSETTTYGQQWSAIIREGSSNAGISGVISAINAETKATRATHADVIVACALVLGQSIGAGPTDIAKEMRAGIHEMVNAFATQAASLEMKL